MTDELEEVRPTPPMCAAIAMINTKPTYTHTHIYIYTYVSLQPIGGSNGLSDGCHSGNFFAWHDIHMHIYIYIIGIV